MGQKNTGKVVEGSGYSLLNEEEMAERLGVTLPSIREAISERERTDRAEAWAQYNLTPWWQRPFVHKPQ